MNRLHQYRGAGGFSLVELMVAILVALILSAGILQILLNNQESYRAQQASAGVQENLRLAAFVLENHISHAGFYIDMEEGPEAIFRATSAGNAPNFATAAVVAGRSNANGSDVLRLRFQADGGLEDCRGAVGAPGAAVARTIELSVSDGALVCLNVETSGQARLVENVDRFEVRYGLDTNGDASVDRYQSTLTQAQTSQVLSIRIQLLIHGDDGEPYYPTPVRQEYRFMDGAANNPTVFEDRRIRRLLDRTIALRNQLP